MPYKFPDYLGIFDPQPPLYSISDIFALYVFEIQAAGDDGFTRVMGTLEHTVRSAPFSGSISDHNVNLTAHMRPPLHCMAMARSPDTFIGIWQYGQQHGTLQLHDQNSAEYLLLHELHLRNRMVIAENPPA